MYYDKPVVNTGLPGPKSKIFLDKLKKINGGWSIPYPFVHGEKGQGCYFEDIDGNIFLDFASQVCSSPLGYNHPVLLKTLASKTKFSPFKFAGQDFVVREHLELIEELLSISPKDMNAAFLVNSGAEAVENSLKIAMRKQKSSKFGISFESAFHGRTLGALSTTNSKVVHKHGYLSLPVRRLPFDDEAPFKLERIFEQENSSSEIAFVIVEPIQGEGGYNIASQKMLKKIREITKDQGVPLICDEVQSGMGRTGKWWAYQNFGITPDIFSSAKALQVGATVSSKSMFPEKPGAISSTWGGGHVLDLANGTQIIQYIKKHNLLTHVSSMGFYLIKTLKEIQHSYPTILNVRGLGLMVAFDFLNQELRDKIIVEMLKRGVVLLGCGSKGIRVVPPYIVTKKEIDIFAFLLDESIKKCNDSKYKHTGSICDYISCGHTHS